MDEIVKRAVERAIVTMQQNLGERLTIDDMARSAMFSKFHFSRVFQRVTGVSPGRFLSAMRLEEAKRLLVTTQFTVADISHRVGYNSVGTFSSRFRSSVGVSPTTYRQLGGITLEIAVEASDAVRSTSTVRGHVVAPPGDQLGLLFVGLFPGRILQGPPVTYSILQRPGSYTLSNVPLGTWYLMAYSITPGTNPELGQASYIGSHGPIKIVPDVVARIADVQLRRMRLVDPPVLMALPDTGSASLRAVAS
jgi:AraC family transcriptional regulator